MVVDVHALVSLGCVVCAETKAVSETATTLYVIMELLMLGEATGWLAQLDLRFK